jgi:hypothetical protein
LNCSTHSSSFQSINSINNWRSAIAVYAVKAVEDLLNKKESDGEVDTPDERGQYVIELLGEVQDDDPALPFLYTEWDETDETNRKVCQ